MVQSGGRSQREVALHFGVSRATLAKYMARAAPQSATPAPWTGLTKALTERKAQAVERDVGAPPLDTTGDARRAIDILRDLLARSERSALEAHNLGNATVVQRCTRDAAGIGIALARLEKAEQADAHVHRINNAEILATADALRDRIKIMVSRPLCCARCSRQLSVDWAYEGREKPDVIKDFLASDEAGEALR